MVVAIAFGFHGFKPLIAMLVGAGVGAFAPSYYIGRKARNRRDLIASSTFRRFGPAGSLVEAGLGLSEAIKIVGSETARQKQEIGAELAMVSGELTAGSSLGQALKSFAERTNVEDIKPLAATLCKAKKLGAQIVPRCARSPTRCAPLAGLRAEEAAAKTTVKILFPLVLFILPAMMSVIVGPAMIQIMRALTSVHTQ